MKFNTKRTILAAFVAASLVTMLGVKHGDTKILKKTGPDAFDKGD